MNVRSPRIGSRKLALAIAALGATLLPVTATSHASDTRSIFTWSRLSGLPNRTWINVSGSGDGRHLYVAPNRDLTINNFAPLFRSDDYGATWTDLTVTTHPTFKKISVDSTGRLVFAAENFPHIYTSRDSGVTWTERVPGLAIRVSEIASSSNGMKLAAAKIGGSLYTSSDGGESWQESYPGMASTMGMAFANQGNTILLTKSSGSLLRSDDFGAHWRTLSIPSEFVYTVLRASEDGKTLALTANGVVMHTSTDGGVTWLTHPFVRITATPIMEMSKDGSKIFLIMGGTRTINYSSDYGRNWSSEILPFIPAGLDAYLDDRGTRLVLGSSDNQLWSAAINFPTPPSPPSKAPTEPAQQSSLATQSVDLAFSSDPTTATVKGNFVEAIRSIHLDGTPLYPGSWLQGSDQLTIKLPALTSGAHELSIFNGSIPSLSAAINVGQAPPVIKVPQAPRIRYLRCIRPNGVLRVYYGKNPSCRPGEVARN